MEQTRRDPARRAQSVGSSTISRMPSQSFRRPDGSPGPQARHRITTSLSRPADAAVQPSPLAQLFQPVIVDEAIPEDVRLTAGTRDGVSYGSLSRRRLSGTTLQKMLLASRESEPGLTRSPGQLSEGLWEPETAGETEEKESTLGNLEWARRLDSIEKRQKRIEDLLIELVRGDGKM
jgi:hypothetical protein